LRSSNDTHLKDAPHHSVSRVPRIVCGARGARAREALQRCAQRRGRTSGGVLPAVVWLRVYSGVDDDRRLFSVCGAR
jgi:hypothetical protein